MSTYKENGRYSRWLLLLAAGVALVLSLMVAILEAGNQHRLATVTERQEFINQTISLSNYNIQQVKLLATMVVKTRDQQLDAILKAHGITYSSQ